MSFYTKLTDLLKTNPNFVDDEGELLLAAVQDRAWKLDHDLIRLLLSDDEMKEKFFDVVDSALLFKTSTFIEYISQKNFLDNSYTRFRNELLAQDEINRMSDPKVLTKLEPIGALTEIEKIKALIREGESKKLEFKETLSLNVEKQTKEKYLETSALKTLVAFLNSDGGNLLVGVSDTGVVTGLNKEIEKFDSTRDNFLKRWKNLIKEHIGEPFYPFIDYRLIDVDGKIVLNVECQPSLKFECYLDKKDFYVRTNPATDKLEGPKLVEYVKNRFPSPAVYS